MQEPNTKPLFNDPVFKDHVIVVTGGGTGLGRSMTEYLSSLGGKLVITSRKANVLEETATAIEKKTGEEVLPVECDIREPDQVDRLRDQVKERFGRIDALINNAAGNFISPTERLSYRAFHTVIDIVLKGTANCTLCFGKDWIEQERPGTILNIVTTYASTGSGYVTPSACAKAGVQAMTRSLAVEWAKYGIRTNAIAPGPFPTKGAWERLFPEEVQKYMDPKKRIPLQRNGEHQELANLAAYLLSSWSGYMNGEVLTIDGGEWLKGAGQFNWLDEMPPELWDELQKNMKK